METKRFNEQVKRNMERFPKEFMFRLNQEEYISLRSQFSTLKIDGDLRGRHRKYLPYAFTEQGVSMLSAVLHSKTAIKISIQIINAFVEMKHFLSKNNAIFNRLNIVETKLLKHDDKFNKIFELLEYKNFNNYDEGIFYDGQLFDSYKFISDLIRSAKKRIILIDNYIDDRTLNLFKKSNNFVNVIIYTKSISNSLKDDLEKYNSQYKTILIKKFDLSHDRFLIIDDVVYHIGASLKDLGKKWFAFSKMNDLSLDIIKRLND